MKRLLVILVLVLVVVGAVGFYRGWFGFSTARRDEKINVNVSVDEEKIRGDVRQAREQVQEAGQKVTERVGGWSDETTKGNQ